MGYVIALLLLLLSPSTYQAARIDDVVCSEIIEVLDEAVVDGRISKETRDRVANNCTKFYGDE